MSVSSAWSGWLWLRGRGWVLVARGGSLQECGKRLAREARRQGIPDRLSVMTGGGTPAFVPRGEEAVSCEKRSV
jgi:hypothetical protein